VLLVCRVQIGQCTPAVCCRHRSVMGHGTAWRCCMLYAHCACACSPMCKHLLPACVHIDSVMGHSYGGASAVLAAAEHPVFKAVCALDPWW
jgi:hypothetical protein